METILTLLLIGLLIAGSLIAYKHRKTGKKQYLLSENIFPQLVLGIYVQKTNGKLSGIIVRLKALEDEIIKKVQLELITRKRDFGYYDMLENKLIDRLPLSINKHHSTDMVIAYSDLKNLLEDGDLPFLTFRFVVTNENGKPFKSHELGLNKKWQIMRPDSGHYN